MTWNPTTIRSLAVAYGDTQEAFAQRLGCSFPTVNRWLNGHTIPSPAYCRALDAIVAELSALAPEAPTSPPHSPGALANALASGVGAVSSDHQPPHEGSG